MPLHVAKFQIGNGNSPTCRVCNRKFILDKESSAAADAQAPKGHKAKDDKIAKLEKTVAELRKQASNGSNDTGAAKDPKESKQDLKKLQSLLEASKEAGMPTEAIEAKIKDLKQQSEATNAGLSQVLTKLTASINHEKQVAEQILKEEEKLKALKQKAVEAAEKTCKLKEERARLLLVEGHLDQVLPKTQVALPTIPKTANEQQQQQWAAAMQDFNAMQQQQNLLLANTLAQLSASIVASNPVQEPPENSPQAANLGANSGAGLSSASTDGHERAPMEEDTELGSNKNRKGASGNVVHDANGQLSEEQQQKQEAAKEQAAQEQLQKQKKDAEARAAEMLEQARSAKLRGDDEDPEL